MSESLKPVQCPNCGAPLQVPTSHERYFKCEFCGTTLEDKSSQKEWDTGVFKIDITKHAPVNVPTYKAIAPPVVVTPVQPVQTSSRAGCIIGLVVLLFSAGIFAAVMVPGLLAAGVFGDVVQELGLEQISEDLGFDQQLSEVIEGIDSSGLGGMTVWSYGPTQLLAADTDSRPDVVMIGSMSDNTKRMLYVDTDADPALRWMSEPLSDDASYTFNHFLADNDRIYFVFKDNMLTLDRKSGERIWEASLSDEVQFNICTDCMQQFGERIVVLTADGKMEVFSSETGGKEWSARLNTQPRQLLNFGGNPAVLDQIDDVVGLEVFDLETQARIHRIEPECPNEPFPQDPQTPGIYDPILVESDGANIYFKAGFFPPGCIQKWDTSSAEMVWQSLFPIEVIRSVELENMLVTETDLFVANRDGVYAIDLATGEFRTLFEDEDYSFLPVGAVEESLILQAERTRGTRRFEIWAVDVESGETKWTQVPNAGDTMRGFSDVVHDEGLWGAGLTAGGLTLIQLYEEPRRVTVETFKFEDGATGGQSVIQLPDEVGGFWTDMIGWRRNDVWLLAGPQIVVLDPASGETILTWPGK